jgi:hypothetical protein
VIQEVIGVTENGSLTLGALIALSALLVALLGLVASLFNRSAELRERVARLELAVFNGKKDRPGRPD